MKINRIELGQILVACIIILGFSLTLTTYFQNNPQFESYRNIIFWLIIIPFGIEAIITSIANITVKFRKTADIFLILSFISLFIALLILFSYDLFPNFNFISEYSNIIGIILLVIVIIFYFVIEIVGGKYLTDLGSNIHRCYYKINKNLKENEHIDYIVTVSKDVILPDIMSKLIKTLGGAGGRIYYLKDFLKEEIELTEENIVLVTDIEDNVLEIVKRLESFKNIIVGIILTYKPNKKQRELLQAFNTQYYIRK